MLTPALPGIPQFQTSILRAPEDVFSGRAKKAW